MTYNSDNFVPDPLTTYWTLLTPEEQHELYTAIEGDSILRDDDTEANE